MKTLLLAVIFSMVFAVETLAAFCGDENTVYSPVDFNKDCRVDIKDLAMFANMWAFPEAEHSYIDSIEELRAASTQSGRNIYMKPGTYLVKDSLADNQTVFNFSGSDNYFDLSGVTIQIDTTVMSKMTSDEAHELGVYRILGDNITFEGATFENVGDAAPQSSLNDFSVTGDDAVFKNCKFITRGSSPYGYGDMYGKGAGSYVYLRKHAAMSIHGDRCLVEDCYFRIQTFGHAISIHGSQDTVVRNVKMLGELRLTDEIYNETSGPAFDFDFKMMYPDWKLGLPIPLGEMLSLTEDGVRAYLDGEDKFGTLRRTGHITVENCFVERMRGGITLALARSATVSGCTVIDCGYTGHAYSLPSDSTVRNSSGNAAYSPLLFMPYSNRENADIELELLESDYGMGAHSLVMVTGRIYNRVVINYPCQAPVNQLRPIVIGSVGDRYNETNSTPEELAANHMASGYVINNLSPHPIELTQYSDNCNVLSIGAVVDYGVDNTFGIINCED